MIHVTPNQNVSCNQGEPGKDQQTKITGAHKLPQTRRPTFHRLELKSKIKQTWEETWEREREQIFSMMFASPKYKLDFEKQGEVDGEECMD